MRRIAALVLTACLAAGVLVVDDPRAPAQEPPYGPPPGAAIDPGVTVSAALPPPVAPPIPAPTAAAAPRPGAIAAPAPRRLTPRAPSRAVGRPWRGRLVNGVELPAVGPDHVTWDPILKRVPNRAGRRWGTAKLIATIDRVLAAYHVDHPEAPQVLVGDLSRPHGGVFDERFGGLGHASHQNGVDVDVYYPRADGAVRAAWRPDQIDRALAQALVDGFVRAGAQFVFVGTRTGLRGPRKVVEVIAHHNDHLHVRIRPPRTASR
jgi:murein endopeptidase